MQSQNQISNTKDDVESDDEFIQVERIQIDSNDIKDPASNKRVLFDVGDDEDESDDEFVNVETVNTTTVLGL